MIRHDWLPARLRIGEDRWRQARVVVGNDGTAVAFAPTAGTGYEVVARAAGVEVERIRGAGRRWDVRLPSGEIWEVTPGGGCACGSALKRIDVVAALSSPVPPPASSNGPSPSLLASIPLLGGHPSLIGAG